MRAVIANDQEKVSLLVAEQGIDLKIRKGLSDQQKSSYKGEHQRLSSNLDDVAEELINRKNEFEKFEIKHDRDHDDLISLKRKTTTLKDQLKILDRQKISNQNYCPTAYTLAVQNERWHMLPFLGTAEDHTTYLDLACTKENMDFLHVILTAGIDLKHPKVEESFLEAFKKHQLNVLNTFVNHGFDIGRVVKKHKLIEECFKENDVEYLRFLLENNCQFDEWFHFPYQDTYITPSLYMTPLLYCVLNNKEACLRFLLEKNVDVNKHQIYNDEPDAPTCCGCVDSKVEKTALMHAAENGYLNIVQLLIDAGAEINKSDSSIYSALDYAELHNKTDVAKYLISKGASYHVRNRRVLLQTAFIIGSVITSPVWVPVLCCCICVQCEESNRRARRRY